MGGGDRFGLFQTRRLVQFSKLKHDWNLGLLDDHAEDSSTVVWNRARQPSQLGRRQPGNSSTPAISNNSHLSGRLHRLQCGIGIEHDLIPFQLLDHGDTRFDIFWVIAGFEIALQPIEECRRDGEISVGGISIGDRSNMRGHSENFLNDKYRALRLGGGLCNIGR